MQTLATTRKHHTPVCTIRTPNSLKNHTAYVAIMQPCTTTETEIPIVVTHTQLHFEGSQYRASLVCHHFLQAANYKVPKYIFEYYVIFM